MSSLGDVVLATSALEAIGEGAEEGVSVHWVVASEFSEILRGHPRIAQVIEFDRRASGLLDWVDLCRSLFKSGYTEVLDLHGSVRTYFAHFLFLLFSLTHSQDHAVPLWKTLCKKRWRIWGYFIFRKLWPKMLRPRPWVEIYARTAGGVGTERPDLSHLKGPLNHVSAALPKNYICVMPSSHWPGKEWPAERFADLLSRMGEFPVVLGMLSDQASVNLVGIFQQRRVPHLSSVGKLGIRELAALISGARAYLGNDTGLGHLAESLGTPAWVIFGPTVHDQGFGPWREASVALGLSSLGCRPCGRFGRHCQRFWDRRACMRKLTVDHVLEQIPVWKA